MMSSPLSNLFPKMYKENFQNFFETTALFKKQNIFT